MILKPIIGNEPARSLGEGAHSRVDYFETSHYGSKGMFSPFSPAPWRMMGEIEKSSTARPGIRCESLNDAWVLYYRLTQIELKANVGNSSGSYPRWYASSATAKTCTRRVDPELWLEWNHEIVNDYGYEYKKMTCPPLHLSSSDLIDQWESLPKVFKDSCFMIDYTYDQVYDHSETIVRMWPLWYWETENGARTGAVYLVVNCSYSARYYKSMNQYYALNIHLGRDYKYPGTIGTIRNFIIKKTAFDINFELYGSYYATNLGTAGLDTPTLSQPQIYYQGAWS